MSFSRVNNTDASNSTFNHVGRDQINIFNGRDILDKLDPVTMDASSRIGCLPNTRTDVLKFVVDWANDTKSEQKMLWIHGLAGSGKSALSTTIANTFRDSGQLGAFLFFDRDVTERSNPTVVIRTLAHQLGTSDPRIGATIRTSIERNPNITMSPLTRQFRKLVLEPLSELEYNTTIVVVLDALDECGTADEREALLTVLTEDFIDIPLVLRIIITSRAELDIFNAFEYVFAYELDITSQRNSDDIVSYFRHRMALIRTKRRHLRLGTDWPGNDIVQQLVQRASGLFVWASTASKFIDGHDPRRRLDIILSGDTASGAEAALDALYKTALDSVDCWDDEDFVADFRVIMGTILLARVPLSGATIDALLHLPENRPCMNTISLLGCLLQQSPAVRVLHPSFADFLTTEERCGKGIWYFDQSAFHHYLFCRCLDRMNAFLERNMCNMTLAADLRSESLPDDISYSCAFWIDHLCAVQDNISPIVNRLRDFLSQHLLHWFEAMSILRKSRETISHLSRLLDWISTHSPNETLLMALARDAGLFARLFSQSIAAHPLLVYISALPFTPTNTTLYRTYHRPDIFPSISGGFRRIWSPMLLVLTGHTDHVTSVTISADGTHIASGSADGTIRVWDSITGAEVEEIRLGHGVGSVEFYPDGHRIVSGFDDGTVRVWDAISATEVLKMLGHTGAVRSVSVSGHRIVSSSDDKTIRVWDATTGIQALPTIRGHTSSVTCVVFSPDGKTIASASRDGIIRIWDAITGAAVVRALQRHINAVNSVMFSPDGGKLISGSADNTIRIWDLTAGVQTSVLYHTTVTSVGFSPDGQQIISGSYDRTIRVWDVSTGTPLSEFPGHDVSVSSVAYSPDGRQIISGGGDCNVRIWDATSGTNDVLPALEGHHGLVTCIAFSPDGRQIVSGSYNGTVIVWDAISGATSFPPLESHMDEVWFVAFSRDGSCVISRSDGGTILYDATSGHQLHNHHPVEEYDNQFSDSIKVTGGYIIDPVTGRTICHLPSMVSESCYAVHETLLAVGTICGQVFVIHFPPALFTIPDTRAIDRDRMLQGR